MTAREREISNIQKQIAELSERLEFLLSESSSGIEDELLCSFDDFPDDAFKGHKGVIKVYFRSIVYDYRRSNYDNYVYPEWEDLTVGDLIRCDEQKILAIRGFGEKREKALKDWMAKHNLQFVK